MDSKIYCGKLKYLVHWKGYPIKERTWKLVENLSNSQKYIDEFHKKHLFATQMLLYPYLISNLEKILAPDLAMVLITLSIRGKGYLFFIVHSFNW